MGHCEPRIGIEPMTYRLRGGRSCRLSYGGITLGRDAPVVPRGIPGHQGLAGALPLSYQGARLPGQDSNPPPPARWGTRSRTWNLVVQNHALCH